MDALDLSILELRQRIDALAKPSELPTPAPRGPRVNALPKGSRVAWTRPKTYRFTVLVGPTSKSLERKATTKTVAGLNELDAQLNLVKALKKEALYLHFIIDVQEIKP